MLKGKISPSMMCADIYDLANTLKIFEKENIEYLHIDVMDGEFVPNFMLSDGIAKQYRKVTNIPLDYHLMVTNPLGKIDYFDLHEGDLMAIHLESTDKIEECLNKIHNKGAKAGLAIKPATSVKELIPYLDLIDFVLVMTVNPGFAGQALVKETLDKINETRELLDKHHKEEIMIEVDGNVSFVNAKIMRERGADIFVAGTSSVFKKDLSLKEGIDGLREAIK